MLKDILAKHGFRFSKKYGQNFLSDTNLLAAIVADSGINSGSLVLEIGAGAGTLTKMLAAASQQVVAFEIDNTLKPVLDEVLEDAQNTEVVFGDFLKFDNEALCEYFPEGAKIDVVANLPYYITTPILFKLLESELNINSITVMLQKEVAERLTARPGTKEYGVITAVIEYKNDTKITRGVGRGLFFPSPEVDSAVIKITPNEKKPRAKSDKMYYRLVRAAFAMRRKTLANNLAAAFSLTKSEAENVLQSAKLAPSIRGEQLSVEDFIRLADELGQLSIINY